MSRMIHILDTLHNYCNKIVVCNIKQVGDIILYIKITKKKKMYYPPGFNINGLFSRWTASWISWSKV